ncbi:bleomycin resistance protein [Pseudonocardia sp. CNS-139]|nr:bleomycin resistance protein [Pseudonocardia sp. CNS-139]
MAIELNHTIVHSHDKRAEAQFVTDVLGLPAATPFGPFAVVEMGNGVSLDFMDVQGEIAVQHYAFLISEAEFDAVAARLRERDLPTWADPGHGRPGFNTHDGGRGLYFDSPAGHNLEVITKPYGG